jgi:hypothetical protein
VKLEMGAHAARAAALLGSWGGAWAFREICRPDSSSAWWLALAAGAALASAGVVLILAETASPR